MVSSLFANVGRGVDLDLAVLSVVIVSTLLSVHGDSSLPSMASLKSVSRMLVGVLEHVYAVMPFDNMLKYSIGFPSLIFCSFAESQRATAGV